MDDYPRQVLKEIITRYGLIITEEPKRVKGLLKDLAPHHQKENLALLLALEDRVAFDLLTCTDTVPISLHLSRMQKRLLDSTPLSAEMAQWAIESWAVALGKIDESSLAQKEKPEEAPTTPQSIPKRKTSPTGPERKTSSRAGQLRWRYDTGGLIWSSPAVSGDTVCVGSDDQHLYALDAHNGGLRWRYRTGRMDSEMVWLSQRIVHRYSHISSPTVAGDTVYVGSWDHCLYALDAHSGQLRWRYQTGSEVWPSPTVSEGIIYVGSHDRHLYALDAHSGQLRWRHETGDSVFSSPAVSGGIVYVGSGDRHLYALDARSGQLRWRYGTGNRVFSSPTVSDDTVYVGSGDRHLYALDARSGQLRWRYQTGSEVWSSPTVSGDTVYVGSWDDHLYAIWIK